MVDSKKISLWSGPRNISTALMYSFGSRADCGIVDEPLYGYYLCNSNAAEYHPGSKEIIESMECNGSKVIEWMSGKHEKPVMFFKNMTHHLGGLDLSFLSELSNIILTRHPLDMILSFDKVIANPTTKDVGYKAQVDLILKLESNKYPFIVVNSEQILSDPKSTLSKICDFAQIEFDPAMLKWDPGPKPEDGIWAKFWYESVHQSTGFKPYQKKDRQCPERLVALYKESLTYYEVIMERAIE